ncbi:hypothetical protein HHL28_13670 [Aerophototrophica crusticola]|uniref:Glycerophosphoryl diester phosphodiesterase membrane domain-containing protein n=1 Tax=Aerophototrophica crusticola TaxID=1709002 RepID=A0A858RA04_9PROT|nr:hypothetical protein HHL28_13670 [Rhodospirillaceae bacterium B3]
MIAGAVREALAAYLLMLSDPGRVLRFAGAPALVFVVFGLVQLTAGPGSGTLFMLLSVVALVWVQGLWVVRWQRFMLLGEDTAKFWDMPAETRVWKMGGRVLLMFMAAGLLALIAASLLVGLFLTASPPGEGEGPSVAAVLLALVPVVGIVMWLVSRLGPGLTGVSVDRPALLGQSWRATSAMGGLPAFVAFALVNLPLQIIPGLLIFASLATDNPLLALLTQLSLAVVQPLMAALMAILWARIWSAAIDQPLPRRVDLEA